MADSLKELAAATNARLTEFFDAWAKEPLESIFTTQLHGPLFDEVRSLTLRGGKRVRSALLIHGGGLFVPAPEQRKAVMDAACALELLQTHFLIHDDVMDGDDSRRGGPAVHTALARRFGSARMGESLGILAGDLAVSFVQWIVARLEVEESIRQSVAQLFASMQVDVIYGQMLDVIGHLCPEDVALHKTASYTAVGPLCLGATLCGAKKSEVEQLAGLGRDLGIAFQLQDDLIGAFGDPSVTGKPVGSDLRSGKQTFLIIEALREADAVRRREIEAVLGRQDEVTEDEIRKALEVVRSSGAVESVSRRIEELVRSFCDGLANKGYRPEAVAHLVALARFIAARSA
ncbi:MAG: polyprenyl synthetase family protein [Myxococcota bacterium]|jgi:geranylgeranyl diphosphate synthase type I|nr:polyprenyl synthetase family protein [Myxococcota bacterium]